MSEVLRDFFVSHDKRVLIIFSRYSCVVFGYLWYFLFELANLVMIYITGLIKNSNILCKFTLNM